MRLILTAAIFLGLTGCSLFKPYKVDIPQGNLITQEMLQQVETGMTKEQVRFLLGSPITANSLTPELWVYYYQETDNGEVETQQLINLHFDQGQLTEIIGNSEIQKP